MVIHVRLRYYDTNGHNFGVESDIPNRSATQRVYLKLPGGESADLLRAIESYRKARRPTLRSRKIDDWLRNHSIVGALFSARLEISNNGQDHYYYINID